AVLSPCLPPRPAHQRGDAGGACVPCQLEQHPILLRRGGLLGIFRPLPGAQGEHHLLRRTVIALRLPVFTFLKIEFHASPSWAAAAVKSPGPLHLFCPVTAAASGSRCGP